MARFIQFGDAHVRDTETYRELPVNQCTIEKIPKRRGLYIATLDDKSLDVEIPLQINPTLTPQMLEEGFERKRGIVIDFEYEECTPPIGYEGSYTPVGLLFPHVVAIQIGFDPVLYADGLSLFEAARTAVVLAH